MSGPERRLRVGVFADCTATRRTRLLAALELAFPVRFETRRPGSSWDSTPCSTAATGSPRAKPRRRGRRRC